MERHRCVGNEVAGHSPPGKIDLREATWMISPRRLIPDQSRADSECAKRRRLSDSPCGVSRVTFCPSDIPGGLPGLKTNVSDPESATRLALFPVVAGPRLT